MFNKLLGYNDQGDSLSIVRIDFVHNVFFGDWGH